MILFSLNKYQKSCVLGIFNWQGRQSVDFADFWDFYYLKTIYKSKSLIYSSLWSELHSFRFDYDCAESR